MFGKILGILNIIVSIFGLLYTIVLAIIGFAGTVGSPLTGFEITNNHIAVSIFGMGSYILFQIQIQLIHLKKQTP